MSMAYYDLSRFGSHINKWHLQWCQNNDMPVEINSYTEALDWWKRRDGQEYRDTNDRPVGKRDFRTRRMRMRSDGSIEFEYNGHVMCTWHPDQTLTVSPVRGYVSGIFESCVMPRSIETKDGPRVGKIVMIHPENERAWRITMDTDTGVKNMANPEIMVVRADPSVNLRLSPISGRWEPTNLGKCKPFEWLELNKGELRKASQKYNIPEFIRAIETALVMGADIKTRNAYASVGVKTDTVASGEDILTLLEQSRFVEAASLVRSSEDRKWDAAAGKFVVETKGLNSTDIKKIRHVAYEQMGLLYLESERIVNLPQYNNIERKLADFGAP
jgi:hypothetical protein